MEEEAPEVCCPHTQMTSQKRSAVVIEILQP